MREIEEIQDEIDKIASGGDGHCWWFLSSRGEESALGLPGAVGVLCRLLPEVPRLGFVLGPGTTEIGRGCEGLESFSRQLAGIVEGYQWTFQVSRGQVFVSDDRSSNGSVLLKARDSEHWRKSCHELWELGCGFRLGWDGENEYKNSLLVEPGDVLVGYYEPFVFVPLNQGPRVA